MVPLGFFCYEGGLEKIFGVNILSVLARECSRAAASTLRAFRKSGSVLASTCERAQNVANVVFSMYVHALVSAREHSPDDMTRSSFSQARGLWHQALKFLISTYRGLKVQIAPSCTGIEY